LNGKLNLPFQFVFTWKTGEKVHILGGKCAFSNGQKALVLGENFARLAKLFCNFQMGKIGNFPQFFVQNVANQKQTVFLMKAPKMISHFRWIFLRQTSLDLYFADLYFAESKFKKWRHFAESMKGD